MSGQNPPTLKSSIISQNWPCMSPHIYNQSVKSTILTAEERDKETNGNRSIDNLDVRLLDEDLARLETELLDLLLRDGLAPQQLLDLAESRYQRLSAKYARIRHALTCPGRWAFCQGFRSSAFTRHDVRFARR